jgi:hypothetical protein
LPMRNETRNVRPGDLIQRKRRKLRVSLQVGHAVLIEAYRVRLRRLRGADEREKIILQKLLKRGNQFPLPDAYVPFASERAMRGRRRAMRSRFVQAFANTPAGRVV